MRTIHNIVGIFLATSLLISCQRKNEVIDPAPAPVGGLGGNATLTVTPQHHEKNLFDATVYIKYASTTMPDSLGAFDDTVTVGLLNGRPVAVFSNLKRGDYYLYAEGTDDALDPQNNKVYGGATFKVIDTLEKNYDVYLQISNPTHHTKK